MRVLLGSNVIEDCDAALYVNGEEVFRFREALVNDQLVCDFDVRALDDSRIAKIAKNQVVHAADGYKYASSAVGATVTDSAGFVVASVERLDTATLRLNGTFHVKGFRVVITNDAILLPGSVVISGNHVQGFPKGISLTPKSFAIGSP